ncbi:MAG: polyprenyl synthetase family protein [Bacteroidales bacterium]|jgi:geranylgeranyl diphosphate synthase type II|nr:polyprenyl synthetase family protein [Bacteroidales bacterium]
MYNIDELQKLINEYISKINFDKEPNLLYQPITYTIGTGGKRIRPALVLLACNVFSDNIEPAIKPAIGLEIFHNFTLLHDDVMDNADVRRNKSTVHKKWDNNVAILSGDAMFIKAYEYFLNNDYDNFKEVLRVFNSTAIEVCEGQQYDMDFEKRIDVTEKEYLEMIRLKTSVLIAASLKIGALIGGADTKNANFLYEFGINIGLGFQLQDDMLDTFGDEKVFGKKIGGDIIANKKTYLLIKSLEIADKDTTKELKSLLEYHSDNEKKIAAIKFIFEKLDIQKITQDKIKDFYTKATNALSEADISINAKNELIQFAKKLINRIK